MAFQDDGPALATGGNIVVPNTLNATDFETFVSDVGSDASGAFKITSAPTTGGFTWAYADVDGGGIGDHEIIGKLNGANFYSLVVDSTGKYTFKLLDTLDPNQLTLGSTVIKAGAPDTQYIDVGVKDDGIPVPGQFVRISGFAGATPDAINESHRNVGVDNGNLDANESMVFQLFEDTTPNAPGGEAAVPISNLTIGTKTAQSVTYHYELYLGGTDSSNLVYADTVTVGKTDPSPWLIRIRTSSTMRS